MPEASAEPLPFDLERTPGGRRFRVLMSAYACEPGKGSEPGVGWNMAREMSRYHHVWLITRANNRDAIEPALAATGGANLRVVYYDLPAWARWWKKGPRGVQLYYYLWQVGAYFVARRLHDAIGFDLAHHVTFVKYWVPSFLPLLPLPFIWGPVGGGESTPLHLWKEMRLRSIAYEALRVIARTLGEWDPFVRLAARRSAIALATTHETASRLQRLGARRVYVTGGPALSRQDISRLAAGAFPRKSSVRLISIGHLTWYKGFHLAIRAASRIGMANVEYLIIGDGPERHRLERLADRLELHRHVQFLGSMSRADVLSHLRRCDILVHPSLHDSGAWVCLEAMAAGLPVVCLDLGGPSMLVSADAGIKVNPHGSYEVVVNGLASAIRRLIADPEMRSRLGAGGRRRVQRRFLWESRAKVLATAYAQAVAEDGASAGPMANLRDTAMARTKAETGSGGLGREMRAEGSLSPATHRLLWLGRGRTLWIPRVPAEAAMSALALYQPRALAGRLAKQFLGAQLQLLGSVFVHVPGAPHSLQNRCARVVDGDLVDHLARILSIRACLVAVLVGPPGPQQKPVVLLLSPDGRPLGYAKIGWNEVTRTLVKTEAEALRWLGGQDYAHIEFPRVLYAGGYGDCAIVVTAPLDNRSPMRTVAPAYLRALQEIGGRGLRVVPFGSSGFTPLLANRAAAVRRHLPEPMSRTLLDVVALLDSTLAHSSIPFTWSLGDFAAWNLGMNSQSGKVVAVDLENASPRRPVGWDLFHFLTWGGTRAYQEAFLDPRTRRNGASEVFQALGVEVSLVPYMYLAYLADIWSQRAAAHADDGPISLHALAALRRGFHLASEAAAKIGARPPHGAVVLPASR